MAILQDQGLIGHCHQVSISTDVTCTCEMGQQQKEAVWLLYRVPHWKLMFCAAPGWKPILADTISSESPLRAQGSATNTGDPTVVPAACVLSYGEYVK